MQQKSPRASAGLSRFAASMPASSPAPPAPISMCSSSMKRMMRGSAVTSSSTFFSRSSNSPRYFVSATSRPSCSEMRRFPCRFAGTSRAMIRCARPSTTAVFPTPGSPSRQGLLLRRRTKIRIMRSTSLWRPMRGSSFPSSASAVRSMPHSFSTLFFPAFFSLPPTPTFSRRSFAAATPPCSSNSSTSWSTSSSCEIMEKALLVGEDSMASTTSRALTVDGTLLAATRRIPFSSSPIGMSRGPEPLALLLPNRPHDPFFSGSDSSPARTSSGCTASGLSPRRRRTAGALSDRCNPITASCFTIPNNICSEPTSAAPVAFAATIPSWIAFSDSLSKRSYGTLAAAQTIANLSRLPDELSSGRPGQRRPSGPAKLCVTTTVVFRAAGARTLGAVRAEL
mmetsp:Transcript_23354/g.41482  ORF Transcript_23354/g.41482 Transcript_23354/m.41482 type:complete len:396 (-) Transcript_23354:181-1368(-)